MIRIGAIGDIHVAADTAGRWRTALERIDDEADVLLIAGDLTKCGTVAEADLVADELADVTVPVVAVLGNHDHHDGRPTEVAGRLGRRGIRVLEGDEVVLSVAGWRLGVAGVKGFGGGFAGACATEFGEAETKSFVRHSIEVAEQLGAALDRLTALGCDRRVALTHYAPVPDTLVGERLELYPFLGSQHLGEAIDDAEADLAVHGHAHGGTERGRTPSGIPVRNVAMPVVRSAYRVYELAGPLPAAAAGPHAPRHHGDR